MSILSRFRTPPAQRWAEIIDELGKTARGYDREARWLAALGLDRVAERRRELAASQQAIAARMTTCPNRPEPDGEISQPAWASVVVDVAPVGGVGFRGPGGRCGDRRRRLDGPPHASAHPPGGGCLVKGPASHRRTPAVNGRAVACRVLGVVLLIITAGMCLIGYAADRPWVICLALVPAAGCVLARVGYELTKGKRR